jgi:hypothetical protein
MIASGEDLRWGVQSAGVRPTLFTAFVQRYMDLVLRRARKDARVARIYWDVVGMIAPSRALFGREVLPGVLSEVLGRVGSLSSKAPDPKEEAALPSEALDVLRGRPTTRAVG